jgi:hypothetical protein
MGEICKSGSMSGEGKRDDAAWPPVTAPFFDSTAGRHGSPPSRGQNLSPGADRGVAQMRSARLNIAQAILPTLQAAQTYTLR